MMKKKLKDLLAAAYTPIEESQSPTYAVAIVLSAQNEILLIERALRPGDHWSGHMAFPGGKQEPTDIDLLATARRETQEEVGLILQTSDSLGPMIDISLRKRGLPVPGCIHSFVFAVEKIDLHLDSAEVENAFWIPLEHFSDRQNMGEYKLQRDNLTVSLPCVDYQEKKIWGLTYQLLCYFFSLYQKLDGRDYSHLRPTL